MAEGVLEISWKASASINPSRFAKQDSSGDFLVTVCGAGERSIGITGDSTKYPQVATGFGSGMGTVHCEANDHVKLWAPGERCLLECNNAGSAAAPTISAGDWIISAANGIGVKWTTNGTGGNTADTPSNIGALALVIPTAGLSSVLVDVMVLYFSHTP